MHGESWQRFFDAHAPHYLENCFTKNTEAEVAFIIDALQLPAGSHLLDVGCGAGRHAVALAERGYRVTGVDLSPGMLAEARTRATAAGVPVELVQADATVYRHPEPVDGAICLCEGAFGLLGMGEDALEHDLAILRNIHAALRPSAPLLLTVLSVMRMVRQATPEDVAAGRFDPLTSTTCSEIPLDGTAGETVMVRERGYMPTEFRLLLRYAGFEVAHLGGGTAGQWGYRPPELDEYELMALARKA